MVDDLFERLLSNVAGKIRTLNVADEFDHKSGSILYYWDRAEKLNRGALVVLQNDQLLNEIFALLAGLSLELLLKGILLGLGVKNPKNHKLIQLCELAGISISEDDQVILRALTEYVTWASKYPAPNDANALSAASDIFAMQHRRGGKLSNRNIPERSISAENYDRLWLKFAGYFYRVQSNTFESAVFSRGQ